MPVHPQDRRSRRAARALTVVLAVLGLVPLILSAAEWLRASPGMARSIALALVLTGAFSHALTSLPALLLVRRRPWAALVLAALLPVAWVTVMRFM